MLAPPVCLRASGFYHVCLGQRHFGGKSYALKPAPKELLIERDELTGWLQGILWWCGRSGYDPPPTVISRLAFAGPAKLVADYLMPMAERVYGDAAATDAEGRVATLARWALKTRAAEVHIRHLQRQERLPGLRDAETIRATCERMVEAGWLIAPRSGSVARAKFPIESILWCSGSRHDPPGCSLSRSLSLIR